jgi:hypothetical protein
MHNHTHTHTHIQTRTRARAYTHAHTRSNAYIYLYIYNIYTDYFVGGASQGTFSKGSSEPTLWTTFVSHVKTVQGSWVQGVGPMYHLHISLSRPSHLPSLVPSPSLPLDYPPTMSLLI